MHAVHRGSTTYPATTRSAPLGLDAHSKTSNTVQQRALGGVPGPAALMLHYVPICCTGLQRVALDCNALHCNATCCTGRPCSRRAWICRPGPWLPMRIPIIPCSINQSPIQRSAVAAAATPCCATRVRTALPPDVSRLTRPSRHVHALHCTALHRTAPPCRERPRAPSVGAAALGASE